MLTGRYQQTFGFWDNIGPYRLNKDVTEYPTVDFYGNPVDLSTGTPNIGACNAKHGEITRSQPTVSAL